MLKLDLDAAERFVSGYPDASWDGWTILIFKENAAGASRMDGAFKNGKWGVMNRVEPDSQGRYRVRV